MDKEELLSTVVKTILKENNEFLQGFILGNYSQEEFVENIRKTLDIYDTKLKEIEGNGV